MLREVTGLEMFRIELQITSGTFSGNPSQARKAIIQSNMKKLEKDILISMKLLSVAKDFERKCTIQFNRIK